MIAEAVKGYTGPGKLPAEVKAIVIPFGFLPGTKPRRVVLKGFHNGQWIGTEGEYLPEYVVLCRDTKENWNKIHSVWIKFEKALEELTALRQIEHLTPVNAR